MVKRRKYRGHYIKQIFLRVIQLCFCVAILSVMMVAGLRWINPPTSAFMLSYRLFSEHELEIQHRWRDWNEISVSLPLAVIAAEDQRYPEHNGFDFKQLKRAWHDYQEGKGLRGASTISQQTAKNLFLWQGKNIIRKGMEAWFTFWMELFLPKQRILEIYLNIAEFGIGIYGVEAAGEVYFQKYASAITRSEAALLASVLPSPKHYRVLNPSTFILKRQRWILTQMSQLGEQTILKLERKEASLTIKKR